MALRKDAVSLVVGRAEALILFEMLAEFCEQPFVEIENSAQRIALVRLHGALESVLVEPFMPEYVDLVSEAQTRLTAESGSDE